MKFLLPRNLYTYITLSLIVDQRPRSTNPSSVVTLARHPTSSSLKITDLHQLTSRSIRHHAYVMLHLVSGINCQYLFVNPILVPVPPFPTHLCLHPSLFPLLIHHSVHLFTPGLKTYLFHKSYPRSSTSFPGLPSRTVTRTVSSKLLGFFFNLSLFFRFGAVR